MRTVVRQSVFMVPGIVTVARECGFFENAGIAVEDTLARSSNQQRHDLDAGSVDVAVTSIDNVFAWDARGSDIGLLAQIETTTDHALMLAPGLTRVEDIPGLRLAVDAATNGFAVVAYALLARLGLEATYEVLEIGGVRERFDALLAGDAELALLVPPLDEAGLAHGMTVVARGPEHLPEYPGLGVVATRPRYAEEKTAIDAYLSALEKARQWLHDTPRTSAAQALASAGMGTASIDSLLALNPASLAPSMRGLRALVELRAEVSMEIPNAPSLDDILWS